jgi:hypothetical protein
VLRSTETVAKIADARIDDAKIVAQEFRKRSGKEFRNLWRELSKYR